MRFIFLTKTPWSEPPRLRHQLARLLACAGHQVLFFEKPRYPWQRLSRTDSTEDNITFYYHRELLHHKLQVVEVLYNINSRFVISELRNATKRVNIDKQDVVVNFHYNYGFLRNIFPHNRLITIINDDFHSRAILNYQKPLVAALEKTCKSSDIVLTVSDPLRDFLSQFCEPQIFLPWPQVEYRNPSLTGIRNLLLFWGYINSKLDLELLGRFSESLRMSHPSMSILFVGPMQLPAKSLRVLEKLPNVILKGATPLDTLPMDKVLTAFIPYRSNVPSINAIAFPNKAFQFLSYGIPFLISGMPYFFQAPFVYRTTGDAGVEIEMIQRQFALIQPAIKDFLSQNSADMRLKQFIDVTTEHPAS